MNEKDDIYIALNGRSEKSSLLEVAAKNSALLHLNYSRQFPVINRWKRALKWLKDLPKNRAPLGNPWLTPIRACQIIHTKPGSKSKTNSSDKLTVLTTKPAGIYTLGDDKWECDCLRRVTSPCAKRERIWHRPLDLLKIFVNSLLLLWRRTPSPKKNRLGQLC